MGWWTVSPRRRWVLLPREDAVRAALADFIARLGRPSDEPTQPLITAPAERTLALPSDTPGPLPTRRR
jgi:hypothetical protein